MTYALQIIFLAVLLVFSAIFSGSETAFFSISPMHRQRMRFLGDRRSRLTLELLRRPTRLLVGILTGNMIVNITATAFMTTMVAQMFPGKGAEYTIPIMTALLLLFGEITPKVIAARWNLVFARTTAEILFWVFKILAPVIALLEKISAVFGPSLFSHEELTEADLRATIDLMRRSGEWEPEIVAAMVGTLELDRIPLTRFAIPRDKWVVANVGATAGEIRKKFSPKAGNVVVLFDEKQIAGIVEPKDLVGIDDDQPADTNVLPPVLMHKNTSPSTLLSTLIGTGIRWVVLIDEDENPVGLVGLETIFSALISEETLGEVI